MQQKLVQNFFKTNWSVWKYLTGERNIKKATPLKNIMYLFGSFLQTCINFVAQRLKLPHFKGSIIP